MEVLQLAGVLAAVIGVPMLVITVIPALGKAIALRLGGGRADDSLLAEVEQLRDRVARLEECESRLAEVEERLDFAERVIARGDERQLHG